MVKLNSNTRATLALVAQLPVGALAVFLQSKALLEANGTGGFSVAVYVSMSLFYMINIYLSYTEYTRARNINNLKMIIPYIVSLVGPVSCIVSCIISRIKEQHLKGEHHLIPIVKSFFIIEDIYVLVFILVGFAVLPLISKRERIPYRDPRFQGYVSGIFIAIPQVFYATTIAMNGIAGISGAALVLWLFPGLLRIYQLRAGNNGHAFDKKQRAIVLSEKMNVISWSPVVLAYGVIWLLISLHFLK